MTGINWQPSFRGAMHAEDVAAQVAAVTTTAAADAGEATHEDRPSSSSSIDPSPLLGDGDDEPDSAAVQARTAATGDSEDSPQNNEPTEAQASSPPSLPTWRHPFTSTLSFFTQLSTYFGWHFLSWLAIEQCFISGGVFALVMALGLPLFKELGIGASRQQLYMALIMSPWAMKPFIGVASDLFPVGGYNKRYLAVFSILVGLIGCCVLLGVYHSGSAEAAKEEGKSATQYFADVVVICFTFISFEASTLDILGEGKYSELMRIHPESGSSIISFKFGWGLLGAMITTACVGPLSDAGYFHVLFWISLVLAVSPLYPTLAGWIPEKKRTDQEPGLTKLCTRCCSSGSSDGGPAGSSSSSSSCILFDKGSFQTRKAPFIIITLCGLCAPLTSAITTYADLTIGLIFSAVLIAMFTVATYYIFPKSFFRIFLAVTLFSLDWISMGSAIGYYYTASEKCVPGGPNFDYTYYISITGIVGSVVNFLGVILYQNTLSSWRIRNVLIFTTVVGCFASFIDVIIIMRWNLAIGIPDKVFFLLGNAVIENLLGVMWGVASSTLFAKMTPPGMESAVFAYAVGIGNFCGMVSNLLGSGIIQWSGMKTLGDECDFEALPYLIIICQILVPLAIGLPACFLIPNALQTEHLIDWDNEDWYSEKPPADEEGAEDTTCEDTLDGSNFLL